MNINESCKLFLRDIYLYDIQACHFQILKKLNINISHIDPNDKEKRNIQIGLLQKNNPNLVSVLRKMTESTIDEYIKENNLDPENIICRQYDGLLVNKKLQITDSYLNFPLRKKFDYF